LIDESSHDTSEIAEADVHCDADAAFKTATDVVAVPCDPERDERVDAYRSWGLAARSLSNHASRKKGRDLPLAAKKVPTYCTAGLPLLMSMVNPTIARSSNPIMKTPLCFALSAA
jgi:hypothetical protein